MSVCPSAFNNSTPTGRIFIKFDIWGFFENLSWKKIQVSLKSEKNNRYYTWRPTYIYDNISLYSFQKEKHLYKVVENQNPHFMFNNFFPENLAIYETTCKNMVQPDCRHTLRICDKYSFPTTTMVTRTCLNTTLYVHSCVVLIKMSLSIPHNTVLFTNDLLIFSLVFIATRFIP
jgi:hypothetical protein